MMLNKFYLLTIVALFSSTAFPMGGPKEPFDTYKAESELTKDQQNFMATAIYKDNSEVKIEGINVNGKAKIKNVFLNRTTAKIPSNIKLKNVVEIEFYGTEGMSLLTSVRFKSGTIEKYLMDNNLIFGGWIQGTERSSTCTLRAEKLQKIIINELILDKNLTKEKKASSTEAKEILEADKDEPIIAAPGAYPAT